jgi:DNA polymerase III delta prime subunit
MSSSQESRQLNIHQNIKDKLKYFHTMRRIPNIIFNGSSGSGKSTIVNEFISLIYDGDKEKIKDFVMYVNCAHGKGIKFIREELKFFAKTHINSNGGDTFKTIVLFNGDKLTMDAQSALRRCIELFSHNTRFFIIVEDKYKLLKPILSRFCEIYVPEPIVEGTSINLYKYNIEETYKLTDIKNQRIEWLKKELLKIIREPNHKIIDDLDELQQFVIKLYEKAYSSLDLIRVINVMIPCSDLGIGQEKKMELLVAFNKVRKEIRNEKLLMMFVINFTFLERNLSLDNMTYI